MERSASEPARDLCKSGYHVILSNNIQNNAATRPAARDLHSRQQRVRFVLIAVLVLNLAVAAAKIIGGLAIGSLAMSADGFQSVLDGAANVVGLIALSVANRPPDPNHPYGHHRFETLTSLVIAGSMLLALFGILQGVWSRVQGGDAPDVTYVSFAIMAVTISVNVFVARWEGNAGRQLQSSFLIADSRQTQADIFVSLSVVGALLAVSFGWVWADLAVSLVIAGVIGWGAWTIVRDASLSLSDVAIQESHEIEQVVLTVPGVKGTHNIRSRGAEGRVWIDLHIQVDPNLTVDQAHDIASRVAQHVEDDFDRPADVTVHVEPADEHHLRTERGYDPGQGPL